MQERISHSHFPSVVISVYAILYQLTAQTEQNSLDKIWQIYNDPRETFFIRIYTYLSQNLLQTDEL